LKIDPKEIEKKLQRIVSERSPSSSPRHLAQVENYIEKEFTSYGLTVENDIFSYRGRRFRNIIGQGGSNPRSPLIIVGAHFDSVTGTPGADDNASGVAVMLEAARTLTKGRLRSPVLFCAFNLEELNMIGSTHFAKKLKAAGAKVNAMISLEMVGYTDSRPGTQKYPIGLSWFYPEQGNFIAVVGNWSSNSLLKKFSRLLRQVPGLPVETLAVPGNGSLIPAVRLSDHSPFWDLDYPALLVTDTSFFRNPHYHGHSDTIDTLDLGFMAKVCEGVVGAVSQMANSYW
jgi:Zn-dependent M28 family amino/carboxypeptidase